jgi:hypothetical protein
MGIQVLVARAVALKAFRAEDGPGASRVALKVWVSPLETNRHLYDP